MSINLVSYQSSIANPLLKLLILVLFLVATWYFYRCRRRYGGILAQISTLLLLGSIAGGIAAAFRYEGDFYSQYKWGESVLNVILALFCLGITLVVRKRLTDASRILVSGEGDDDI